MLRRSSRPRIPALLTLVRKRAEELMIELRNMLVTVIGSAHPVAKVAGL